jgi:hypothetical protein
MSCARFCLASYMPCAGQSFLCVACHRINLILFNPNFANVQDVRRLIEFIYTNAERISHITCSLDSHYPFQIFHPAWWVDADGKHPLPFTIISAEDVEDGTWRPLFKAELSAQYVKELGQEAKKQLTVWPYHVPIGGVGNALDPELWSAVFWHSIARRSQPTW